MNGAGTWDNSSTTHWSDSDGGSSGATAPTSLDNVNFTANSGFGSGGTVSVQSTATANNVTINGGAAKTCLFAFYGNVTFGGTVTFAGNSAINRLLFYSSTTGSPRTITCNGTHSGHQYIDFQDIHIAGTAGTLTGTSIGDCGGNSGISADTPTPQTCTMSTNQSWSTAAIWTSRIPLPQDDVSLSGVTGGTLTADMPRLGKSINWTGASGSPTWNFGTNDNTIYGGLTLITGMTLSSGNTFILAGRGDYVITSSGRTFAQAVYIRNIGGTYTLNDKITVSSSKLITLTSGGFNANDKDVSCGGFDSGSNTYARSLTMGSGIWSLTTTSAINIWNVVSSNLTFSGASATIQITAATSNSRTLAGAGLTYGTLTYTVAGSTGKFTITGSNTFNTINFSDASNARTLTFTKSTTTSVTTFNVNGTSGKLMTVNSDTPGTAANLALATPQESTYLSISDINASNQTLYIGHNSTYGTGNTNVIQADYFTPSLTDSISLTDSTLLQRAMTTSKSDTVTLIENIARHIDFNRIVTDLISTGETFLKTSSRSIGDSVTFVETITKVFVNCRIFTESVILMESMNKQTARTITSAISLSENFTKKPIKSFYETLLDVFLLMEDGYSLLQENGSRILTNFSTDMFLLMEDGFNLLQENGGKILTNSTTLVIFPETFTKSFGHGRVFTEAVTLIEKFSRKITREFNDAITLADTLLRKTAKFFEDLSTDMYLALENSYALLQENGSKIIAKAAQFVITDSLTKQINKSPDESISLIEIISNYLSKLVTDSITFSESLSRYMENILHEVNRLHEMLTVRISNGLIFIESVDLNEALQTFTAKIKSDAVTVFDTISKETGKEYADLIDFAEFLFVYTTRFFLDRISFSEILTRSGIFSRTLIDSISPREIFRSLKALSHFLTDHITPTDVLLIFQHLIRINRIYAKFVVNQVKVKFKTTLMKVKFKD